MFRRNLIDKETVDWQFDGFAWLIDHFSTGVGLPDSELWRPIEDHFPTGEGSLAPRLFEHVRTHYGFSPRVFFDLVAVDAGTGGSLGGVATVQTMGDTACGTYQLTPATYGQPKETIHYRDDMEATELVATFAHELAHAAHARVNEAGGIFDELYELFTDLTAVYFGFGIFLTNTRFELRGYSDANLQGWQAKGAGYLPEADLIFATALFMALKNIPEDEEKAYLKPRLHKPLKAAFKQLQRYEDRIKALRCRAPAFALKGECRLGFVAD